MNILRINTLPGNIQWNLSDNLEKEYNNAKVVKAADTYLVTSLDEVTTYAIFPLHATVLIYVNP